MNNSTQVSWTIVNNRALVSWTIGPKHLINFNPTADNDVTMENVKTLATSYLMFKIGLYTLCFLFTKIQLRKLGSIHTCDLLAVNCCPVSTVPPIISLNNGRYCTNGAHSHLIFGLLMPGLKSSIMGCLLIFHNCPRNRSRLKITGVNGPLLTLPALNICLLTIYCKLMHIIINATHCSKDT